MRGDFFGTSSDFPRQDQPARVGRRWIALVVMCHLLVSMASDPLPSLSEALLDAQTDCFKAWR